MRHGCDRTFLPHFYTPRESKVTVPTLSVPAFLIYECWNATGCGVFSHGGLLQGGGLSTLKDQRRQALAKVGYSRPILLVGFDVMQLRQYR